MKTIFTVKKNEARKVGVILGASRAAGFPYSMKYDKRIAAFVITVIESGAYSK